MSLGYRPRFAARPSGPIVAAALAGTLLVAAGGAASAEPTSPSGIWYTDGDESIIKVHNCASDASTYCGTIVWLKDPKEADGTPKRDTYNKDPAKKTRPIIGLDILLDLAADDDHWTGKAYNPEDGKLYDITFKVKSDKEENDQADLRGCILKFLCKTETFNRAKEVPGGDPTTDAGAGAGAGKKHKPKSAHR